MDKKRERTVIEYKILEILETGNEDCMDDKTEFELYVEGRLVYHESLHITMSKYGLLYQLIYPCLKLSGYVNASKPCDLSTLSRGTNNGSNVCDNGKNPFNFSGFTFTQRLYLRLQFLKLKLQITYFQIKLNLFKGINPFNRGISSPINKLDGSIRQAQPNSHSSKV